MSYVINGYAYDVRAANQNGDIIVFRRNIQTGEVNSKRLTSEEWRVAARSISSLAELFVGKAGTRIVGDQSNKTLVEQTVAQQQPQTAQTNNTIITATKFNTTTIAIIAAAAYFLMR